MYFLVVTSLQKTVRAAPSRGSCVQNCDCSKVYIFKKKSVVLLLYENQTTP